jgi:hypothetical protein
MYTMVYYSAASYNEMGFECKWMQLEEIMLSEVSQDQKHKRYIFSLIDPKIDPKIKTSTIIYKLKCRTCL